MFRALSIKQRLVGVLVFLSIQLIAGGVLGVISLRDASDSMKSLYDNRLVSLGQLDQVVRGLLQNESDIAKAVTVDQAALPTLLDQVDQRIGTVGTVWDEYRATELTADEKALADEFGQARQQYVAQAVKPALAALRSGDTQAAIKLLHGPLTSMFQPLRDKGNALIKVQVDVAKAQYEQSLDTYHTVRAIALGGLALGLLLALVGGYLLVRAITRPLEEAVRVATSVAGGDLTQQLIVRSNDETGKLMQALKHMSESLVDIVAQVRNGTDTIATASDEIASGNQDLSSRTEQQASSLEETASSLEELTATVKQTAEHASQANQLAATAAQVAQKGGAVVADVIDTMASIQESSRRIADIIGVIDGIAFQTNILALNAAVEAARAGEQGRGFAVVAGEVRNLAQRSAVAAKEIRELIGASVDKVEAGNRLVDQAGTTMEDVVYSIKRVTDLMDEIVVATQEQSSGIDQINQAVIQMEQVTQQNAALVEESAAASESMREQAGALTVAVSVFKLDGRQQTVGDVAASATLARPAASKAVPMKPKANVQVTARRLATAGAGGDWEEF